MLINVNLYYRFIYIPQGMRYDGVEIKGMAQSEGKEEFGMDRCTVTMRQGLLGFLLCSLTLELRNALLCPEMAHERDLKQPGR